jgi:phosphotransacetylase
MTKVASRAGLDISAFPLIDAADETSAAGAAVTSVRSGQANLLMKGSLHTSAFMHAVLDGGSGLRGTRRVSHVFVFDVPAYDKPLFVTDAVVNVAPTLTDKADICRNAIELAQVLGVDRPKVAILSAVEVVDPAIPSTVDAAALSKMADRDQITGALVDGPLALDNAISHAAATSKHIVSAVSGDADILVVPNLEAGNILYKDLTYMAGADAAGIVIGTSVPLILTSRADSVRTRIASAAVACLWSRLGSNCALLTK